MKRKFRYSGTHGKGKNASRGAGSRGGRGKAGAHKHKYMQMVKKMIEPWGRKGFVSKNHKSNKYINIEEIKNLNQTEIDLKELGYDKLLGKGRADKAYKITVPKATKIAEEKIKEAGGEIIYG